MGLQEFFYNEIGAFDGIFKPLKKNFIFFSAGKLPGDFRFMEAVNQVVQDDGSGDGDIIAIGKAIDGNFQVMICLFQDGTGKSGKFCAKNNAMRFSSSSNSFKGFAFTEREVAIIL